MQASVDHSTKACIKHTKNTLKRNRLLKCQQYSSESNTFLLPSSVKGEGGGGSKFQKKGYGFVRFNVICVTRGLAGEKHYATIEWPPYRSFIRC